MCTPIVGDQGKVFKKLKPSTQEDRNEIENLRKKLASMEFGKNHALVLASKYKKELDACREQAEKEMERIAKQEAHDKFSRHIKKLSFSGSIGGLEHSNSATLKNGLKTSKFKVGSSNNLRTMISNLVRTCSQREEESEES